MHIPGIGGGGGGYKMGKLQLKKLFFCPTPLRQGKTFCYPPPFKGIETLCASLDACMLMGVGGYMALS